MQAGARNLDGVHPLMLPLAEAPIDSGEVTLGLTARLGAGYDAERVLPQHDIAAIHAHLTIPAGMAPRTALILLKSRALSPEQIPDACLKEAPEGPVTFDFLVEQHGRTVNPASTVIGKISDCLSEQNPALCNAFARLEVDDAIETLREQVQEENIRLLNAKLAPIPGVVAAEIMTDFLAKTTSDHGQTIGVRAGEIDAASGAYLRQNAVYSAIRDIAQLQGKATNTDNLDGVNFFELAERLEAIHRACEAIKASGASQVEKLDAGKIQQTARTAIEAAYAASERVFAGEKDTHKQTIQALNATGKVGRAAHRSLLVNECVIGSQQGVSQSF